MKFIHLEYLWLLCLLIPLIILKLSKKSSHIVIVPHINFWLTEQEIQNTQKIVRFHKILQYIPLFLLFIVTNISLGKPYTGEITNEKKEQNIVLIDTSITMGTMEGDKSRLQQALQIIHDKFSLIKNTTLISTNEIPQVVAIENLSDIKYSSNSNILKSFEIAEQICKEKDNLIIFTDGVHPIWEQEITKWQINHKNTFVHIIGKSSNNIGLFADYHSFEKEVILNIYHDYPLPKTIDLRWGKVNLINGNFSGDLQHQKQILLQQNSFTEKITLEDNFAGWWEFNIDEKESFIDDNRIFCYVSPQKKCKVLLIGSEQKILAALGAYQHLIDNKSGILQTDDFTDSETLYDLLIVTQENHKIVEHVRYTKALFWKTSSFLGGKNLKQITNIYNPKVAFHPISKNIDFSNLRIDKADVYADVKEKIISLQDGAVVWLDFFGDKKYVYVGFEIKDSNITFLPSFPIFIKNIIEWATPELNSEYNIKQVATSPIYLNNNLTYRKEFSLVMNQNGIYIDWYFMLAAYLLCLISYIYLFRFRKSI